MQEDNWLTVDDTGHVPGVAAELPHGHKVLLDAAGNIMAIVSGEDVVAEMKPGTLGMVGEGDFTATVPDGTTLIPVESPDAQQPAQEDVSALTALAPNTLLDVAVSEPEAASEPTVIELDTSVQADRQMSIQQEPPDNVAPESQEQSASDSGTIQEQS
jgi:hypothetical protein